MTCKERESLVRLFERYFYSLNYYIMPTNNDGFDTTLPLQGTLTLENQPTPIDPKEYKPGDQLTNGHGTTYTILSYDGKRYWVQYQNPTGEPQYQHLTSKELTGRELQPLDSKLDQTQLAEITRVARENVLATIHRTEPVEMAFRELTESLSRVGINLNSIQAAEVKALKDGELVTYTVAGRNIQIVKTRGGRDEFVFMEKPDLFLNGTEVIYEHTPDDFR